ncbi:hypothetical protein H4582DRAFT_2075156 [Lactarius indigo]|nr:hypothetical protein H4582DRAFT_2075156 [Lactarius indigo]
MEIVASSSDHSLANRLLFFTSIERRRPGASELLSSGLKKAFVSTMNPPPQVDSRVRWWDARGQIMYGTVKAINVLSDNSHVVVVQVDGGQPPTVTLP